MGSRVKEHSAFVGGIFVLGGMAVLAAIWILGILWVSEKVIPVVSYAIPWIVAIEIACVLPSLFIRRFRPAASLVYVTSFEFFFVYAFMVSLVVSDSIWGSWGVAIGLSLGVVGVIPIAVLASLFAGQWLRLAIVVGACAAGGLSISAASYLGPQK